MFQRALICTDFSDGLHRFVNFVPSLAASGLQQIVFFHSVPLWEEGEIPRVDKAGIQQARDRLSPALEQVPDGVDVEIDVQCGSPTETILRAIEAHQPEVILLGTAQRSLLNEKLFGSTTIAVSQRTELPLLTLRPQLISTYTCEELALRCQHLLRCLLVPYDGGEAGRYLIDQVKQYAQQRPPHSLEQCVLLWVLEEGGRRELTKEYEFQKANEDLEPIKAELEALGLQVMTEVRRGEPLLKILDAAEEFDISAIAVASQRKNIFLEWSVPSLSSKVLRRSWHPVIFFSPPQRR